MTFEEIFIQTYRRAVTAGAESQGFVVAMHVVSIHRTCSLVDFQLVLRCEGEDEAFSRSNKGVPSSPIGHGKRCDERSKFVSFGSVNQDQAIVIINELAASIFEIVEEVLCACV